MLDLIVAVTTTSTTTTTTTTIAAYTTVKDLRLKEPGVRHSGVLIIYIYDFNDRNKKVLF